LQALEILFYCLEILLQVAATPSKEVAILLQAVEASFYDVEMLLQAIEIPFYCLEILLQVAVTSPKEVAILLQAV